MVSMFQKKSSYDKVSTFKYNYWDIPISAAFDIKFYHSTLNPG